MRNLKTVIFEGSELVVKELTTAELDQLLGQEMAEPTMLDRILMPHAINGQLLAMGTGLPVTRLGELAPSRLQPLIDAFKEVNPDFFAMVRMETDLAKNMAAALGAGFDAA